MAEKPRIVSVSPGKEQKKEEGQAPAVPAVNAANVPVQPPPRQAPAPLIKPKIVKESDFSMIVGNNPEEESEIPPERRQASLESDDALYNLRKQQVQDITPVSKDELMKKIEEDRSKRQGGFGKTIRKFFGFQ